MPNNLAIKAKVSVKPWIIPEKKPYCLSVYSEGAHELRLTAIKRSNSTILVRVFELYILRVYCFMPVIENLS